MILVLEPKMKINQTLRNKMIKLTSRTIPVIRSMVDVKGASAKGKNKDHWTLGNSFLTLKSKRNVLVNMEVRKMKC